MSEGISMGGPERLIRAFELVQAEVVFGDPVRRRAYFDNLDFEAYDHQAQWTSNVYLKPPAPLRQPVPNFVNMLIIEGDEDPSLDVEEQMSDDIVYVAPRPALARVLMGEVFDVAKTIEDTEAAATLLRLGSFLTHRRYDGNTRNAAIEYSLLTRGFDASEEDKRHYAKIAEGRNGLRELGIDIDITYLTRTFAEHYVQRQATLRGYTGDLPRGLDEFRISELSQQRPDVFAPLANSVSLRLAERHIGTALATVFGMRTRDLESYLLYPAGEPVLFNTIGLFATVNDSELWELSKLHDTMKMNFIRSITGCFLGDTTIYGSREHLMGQIAQQ
jgi:hypothetical protein